MFIHTFIPWQIGWATAQCPFTSEEGVGDAPDSYAYGEVGFTPDRVPGKGLQTRKKGGFLGSLDSQFPCSEIGTHPS